MLWSPLPARLIICLCGLLFALALVVWFVTPTPPPPASQAAPIPPPRWPQVPLPTGSDPESVHTLYALMVPLATEYRTSGRICAETCGSEYLCVRQRFA